MPCCGRAATRNSKWKATSTGRRAKRLYLEHNGILRTTPLDSVKVAKDGSYSLKAVRPEYPDFYRLRIKNKTITFAIDSTETIAIRGDLQHFATGYTVENSYASEQIKDLRVSIIGIQNKLAGLNDLKDAKEQEQKAAEIDADLQRHKELAHKIIMENPAPRQPTSPYTNK